MSELDRQVGGSHYSGYKIQPLEFIIRNEIPFPEASAIKYILRYKNKNGVEDLEKAKHYIDIMIEEYMKGEQEV